MYPKDRFVPSDPSLGVLLLSGAHDRAHYAFVVASGAAALGRQVVLFATNQGCKMPAGMPAFRPAVWLAWTRCVRLALTWTYA